MDEEEKRRCGTRRLQREAGKLEAGAEGVQGDGEGTTGPRTVREGDSPELVFIGARIGSDSVLSSSQFFEVSEDGHESLKQEFKDKANNTEVLAARSLFLCFVFT